ncbi:MAG: 3'-5' exonuclease [Candidatus Peribacteraceae bacterium]|nr:3'-5' exonuclease [Candidatus Peribacteraceae bacterium]
MHGIQFVALDCETTGVDSQKDNIIELGAVKFSLEKNLASFDSLFHSPTKIPQFVEHLTGVRNSDLEGAPNFADKQKEIAELSAGSILLGHNLPFDIDFIAKAGLDLSDQASFDTFLLAGLLLPRGESLALENLAQRFSVKHENAHRALADAEATRDLFRALLGLAKNFPREKWQQIAELNSTEKLWPQRFAELVLQSEASLQKFPASEKGTLPPRETVVDSLVEEFSGSPKLVEVSARPEEVFAAVEKLDRPSAIFYANNFVARALPGTKFFAPQNYVDPAKLEKFLAQGLSPAELGLAAKLILHEGKNLYELNLTRLENLLFDFIAAEVAPQDSNAKVIVADHAAFEFESSERLKVVVGAATFPENSIRADSLALDLAVLEEVAPQFSDKIQIWWGLLGLLFREAAPRFGRLDLAEASGLTNFSKVIDSGKNLLAELKTALPPRVTKALQNFLDLDAPFTKTLRSNALGEITLVVAPLESDEADLTATFLLDSALDAGDEFAYVKKSLKLPADFPVQKIPVASEQSRFLVAEDSPDPATPQFFPSITKFLITELPKLTGLTAVVFPNRVEAGNFVERATGEMNLPIFFRKLPSVKKLSELDQAVIVFSLGNFRPPVDLHNFILVKLPFFVRDGSDFMSETLPETVLRFKKMWLDFADSDLAEKFIALDSRLMTKKYGQDFLDAIPQKHEGVKISA